MGTYPGPSTCLLVPLLTPPQACWTSHSCHFRGGFGRRCPGNQKLSRGLLAFWACSPAPHSHRPRAGMRMLAVSGRGGVGRCEGEAQVQGPPGAEGGLGRRRGGGTAGAGGPWKPREGRLFPSPRLFPRSSSRPHTVLCPRYLLQPVGLDTSAPPHGRDPTARGPGLALVTRSWVAPSRLQAPLVPL